MENCTTVKSKEEFSQTILRLRAEKRAQKIKTEHDLDGMKSNNMFKIAKSRGFRK